MASIRKRGSNSYLIVVSRGYDYEGNRLKSVQKTVKPPKEYTPKQAEKWVKEQAILFEREVQHTPEPINRSICRPPCRRRCREPNRDKSKRGTTDNTDRADAKHW